MSRQRSLLETFLCTTTPPITPARTDWQDRSWAAVRGRFSAGTGQSKVSPRQVWDIDLSVRRGCIHGIVGENGAGKSTLMSILYGFYQADEGEILIRGESASILSSRDAIDAGIGMVHQHFMLVDTFSVLENVVLGAETHRLLKPNTRNARGDSQGLVSSRRHPDP